MTENSNLPFPELLAGDRGKHWEVVDSQHGETSMLDPEHKKMSAPGDDYPCIDCGEIHDPAIRVHEMMHAKYSPVGEYRRSFTHRKRKRFVEDKYIHMAEETRIDYLSAKAWYRDGARMWDDPEGYYPACGPALKQTLAHHLLRGEFRSAAEIIYMMARSYPSSAKDAEAFDESIYDVFLDASVNFLKQLGVKKVTSRMADAAFNTGVEYFLEVLDRDNPGAIAKMKKPTRKKLAHYLAGVQSLYFNRGSLASSEMLTNETPKSLKDISWSKVLRYGYLLQEKFKDFEDATSASGSMTAAAIEDLMEGEAAAMPATHYEFKIDPEGVAKKTTKPAPAGSPSVMPPTVTRGGSADYHRPTEGKLDHEDLMGKLDMPIAEPPGGDVAYRVASNAWQRMKVTKPTYDKRIPEWKLQRAKARAKDEGAIPRFMHRFVSDKRVFSRKYKIPTVSLLIDDSGSMGLPSEEISEIVDAAPGSIVGVYAGSDGAGGEKGRLSVIAFEGERTTEEVGIDEYGGNGIDYPALEWLAEQPWPRIWFSDGGVTSPFGYSGRNTLYSQCEQLMHAAGIVRVRNMDQLREIVEGKVRLPEPKMGYYKRNKADKPKLLLTDDWRGRSQRGYRDA